MKLPDGGSGLLMPRYQSLDRRLATGLSLPEAIRIVKAVNGLLERTGMVHGNLRPSNILINERGEPVLCDVLTPAAAMVRARLEKLSAAPHTDAHPPEAGPDQPPQPSWDTWSLCWILYRASMNGGTTDPRHVEPMPRPGEGLDKVAIATLKDRALERLKMAHANPRFAARVAERLGALLHRGLSADHQPSPPYRFADAAALAPRLDEVALLIEPRIEDVGRLLLAAKAPNGVFQGDGDVSFSVSLSCTPNVLRHEDIATGIQLVDVDAEDDGRLKLEDVAYTVNTHPSGRLRFEFSIPAVPPGRYSVRTAFAVRESGHEPVVATGAFEMRPPPGWIPPAVDPPTPTNTIRFHDHANEQAAAPVATVSAMLDDAEVINGLFPSPIAPSTADEELRAELADRPEPSQARAPVRAVATGTDPDYRVPAASNSPTLEPPESGPMPVRPAPIQNPSAPLPVGLSPLQLKPNVSVGPMRPAPPPTEPPEPEFVQPKAQRPAPVGIAMPRPGLAMPPPQAAPPQPRPAPAVSVEMVPSTNGDDVSYPSWPSVPSMGSMGSTGAPSGPSISMGGPSISMGGPSPTAQAGPSIAMPGPGLAPPRPEPSLGPAAQWEPELPDPLPFDARLPPAVDEYEAVPFAQENTEELPTFDGSGRRPVRSPGEAVDRALELLRADSWIATVTASSVAFGLLVVLFVLTRACG